jgi:NhaP-type Na+/H+ or K+/H+ antiporter
MFEHRTKPLLPRKEYYHRLAHHAALGVAVIAGSLGIGMIGYHAFENLPWVDAFLNAAMILSGMGPVATLQTDAGKIFAGCYALFSGITLIGILGIIFAPVVHRFLHKFHLEDEDRRKKNE